MAYRVNGEEIVRDSSRDYEYNPVSDSWVDSGPSSRPTPSYSDDVLQTMQEQERKEKEWEDLERRAAERREQAEYDRLKISREFYERRETQKEELNQARREAYERACKRYREKSPFYRLLHKKPEEYDWHNMYPQEIDNLYQGRAK